jgi:uncharacterized protein (UPF0332 family)
MVRRKSNYLESSNKYLNDSESLLKKGDYAQASEKIWGSVVTILKAIAETKGRRLTTHQGVNYFFSDIAKELKDKTVHDMAVKANALHQNFYENSLHPDSVKKNIKDLKRFILRLQTRYPLNGK